MTMPIASKSERARMLGSVPAGSVRVGVLITVLSFGVLVANGFVAQNTYIFPKSLAAVEDYPLSVVLLPLAFLTAFSVAAVLATGVAYLAAVPLSQFVMSRIARFGSIALSLGAQAVVGVAVSGGLFLALALAMRWMLGIGDYPSLWLNAIAISVAAGLCSALGRLYVIREARRLLPVQVTS